MCGISEDYGYELFVSHGEQLQWFDKLIDESKNINDSCRPELSAPKIEGDDLRSVQKFDELMHFTKIKLNSILELLNSVKRGCSSIRRVLLKSTV